MPPSTSPPSPLSESSERGSVANPESVQGSGLPTVATGGLRGLDFAAVILAAGLSSRMGDNKLLLPWTDGAPIISHVLRAYANANVKPIIVVTGRDAERVAAVVADYQPTLAHNTDFATGEMLSSVKRGLRALPSATQAVFIQPGDMPGMTGAVIERLAAAHEPGWNVAPRYQGRRGHPVLLDRAHWRAMLDLPAGARPRAALRGTRLRLLEVAEAGVLLDVDTRAAYEEVMEATQSTQSGSPESPRQSPS